MEKLYYKKMNNSNNVLIIDLHNGFSIMSVSGFDSETGKCKISLFIGQNGIDTWSLIEKADGIEIDTHGNSLNMSILKLVSSYLESGFFDYYMKRYQFMVACVDSFYNLLEKAQYDSE